MKQPLLKYGFSLWLSACLLAGLSAWSGEVFAQTRKVDKVLQTKKKKKEKKKNRATKRPKGNRGGADVEEAFEPPMERKAPSVGKPLPNPFKRIKAVRRPKKNKDGRNAIKAQEPLMESNYPSVGAPLPKDDKHYQPELNGKKTLFLKKREAQKQQKIFQGKRKVNKNQIRQPGTHHEDRPVGLSNQYSTSNEAASHSGHQKVRRRDISEPGTHHSERRGGAGREAEGPTYAGSRKVKKKDITEPGTGQQKSQRAIGRHQHEQGTGFMGFLRKKKRDIHQPGTHHEDRPVGLSYQYANSNEAASHSGHQKVRKRDIQEPGTHHSERRGGAGREAEGPTYAGSRKVKKSSIQQPGTHHSDRKMSRADRKNLEASNHAGNLRVKKKHLKEPGTLHNERNRALARQYSSYEATNFEGHLKAMSKRQRSRFYEKQSKKVHQFEGNIKLRYNKENMHPSHVARRARHMKSAERVGRYRSFSRWWNRLWSKGQPDAVKEKPLKPRYDKKEKEIWENSRNW